MAQLVFHEHPRQSGECLKGAFAAYVGRIPVVADADLEAVWQGIRRRPFESDTGGVWGPGLVSSGEPPSLRGVVADRRCTPVQRSRIWPAKMNCWEATAHFVAVAVKVLAGRWTVHVWDQDLPNGARHMWPSLMTPQGDHFLVDLNSVAGRARQRG